MKNIKEKELLVNFARSMGQEVDPGLVEEVERIKSIKASVRKSATENIFKDLSEAFKQAKLAPTYEPDDGPLLEEQIEQIKETVTIEYPKPPSLDDLMLLLNEKTETINELVQSQAPEIPVATTAPSAPEEISEEETKAEEPAIVEKTLADRTSDFISKSKDSYQQPDPLIVASDMDAVTKKLRFLEQWISKISMAGPGGGAGDILNLDHRTTLVTTSHYHVARKDYYIGVNCAARTTIVLPAGAKNGRNIIIKDESGHCARYPIIVQGTVDNNINGFVLRINNGGIHMIYRDGWRIV